MFWEEFADRCEKTMLESCRNYEYLMLGMLSEIGEVAGKVKKKIRGDQVDSEAIAHEIGDCLWYAAMIDRYCVVIKDDCGDVGEINSSVVQTEPGIDVYRASLIRLYKAVNIIDAELSFSVQSDVCLIVHILDEIAGLFGISLLNCAQLVLKKLENRAQRGVLHGSGDNR